MKKIKILVGICSHFKGEEQRRIIRETWLKYNPSESEIVCRFFIGGHSIPEGEEADTIALGSNDSYEHLPQKCFDFYRWGYENFTFDYIFKCDDDTFLALDRLSNVIDKSYDLIGDPSTANPERLAPSGGAGYFLSHRLVKALLSCEIPETGYEDLIFGELALKLGFPCKADERLCMHPGKPPLSDNDMVSCHWCSKEQMVLFDQLYRAKPVLTLKAIHAHWKSPLVLYQNGMLRKTKGGELARLENHGNGLLSINWLDWEKELVWKTTPKTYLGENLKITCSTPKLLDQFLEPAEDFYTTAPRAAICISSYKRVEHLERQLFAMLHQDYPHKHIFASVKGVSEYFFKKIILPQFQKFIDDGLLTLRHFPNKNQLSNFVDTVRDLDISEYDLFFKIDDDDYYAPTYVSDCCAFHQPLPRTWSSYLVDSDLNLNDIYGYPRIVRHPYNGIFGFTMVFSKKVMDFIVECDRNPLVMHPISARWDKGEGHHFYGFNEDHFYHNIMKEFGEQNRRDFNREKGYPFHIMVNKVVPSMTRGDGTLAEDFKEVNGEVCNKPERWEHILDIRHPYWESPFRLFNGSGVRLDINDAFTILEFDGDTLLVKWDNYGTEKFVRQEDGLFVYAPE